MQLEAIEQDAQGRTWYKVRYLYGDDFADGRLKWTDTDVIYVLAAETMGTDSQTLTITDYAFSTVPTSTRRRATAMDGFSLKAANGAIGTFTPGQSGVYGSSGRDNAYTSKKMSSNLALKAHIIQYLKTRDVYAGYRASGYSKKYLEAHEEAIQQHKEAKEAFNRLGLKKLPTVKSLQLEYESLAAQRKQEYAAYLQAKSEKRELLTVKANVDRILAPEEKQRKRTKETRQSDDWTR